MKTLVPFAVVTGVVWALVAVQPGYTGEEPSQPGSRTLLAQAQAPERAAEQQTEPTPRRRVTRRLPNYYGQIGLTQKQRETIYGIQEQYQSEMDELERKLAELRMKRDQEIEAVLTDEQKERLAERLKEAEERRAARRRAAAQQREEGTTAPPDDSDR